MPKFLIVLFLILNSYFLIPAPVNAQSFGWEIQSFDSNIDVKPDGKVNVTETIKVTFDVDKHGIFRDIPYIYSDSSGKTYTEINNIQTFRDNSPEKSQVTKSDGYIHIKIGDPNKTLTQNHTYQIKYTLSGILRPFDDHDELYYNVTGNDWDIPLNHATATVNIPDQAIQKVTCYQGPSGSQETCDSQFTPYTATFESQLSQTGEGLTVVVGYKKGTVPIIVIKPKEPDLKIALGIFLASLTVGLFSVIRKWIKSGRDARFINRIRVRNDTKQEVEPIAAHETIVVEYTPPEKLRPAEIGVLMDERADTLDVSATIIDLASRGYLTITEEKKSWLFGKNDYTLSRTAKEPGDLLGYENLLLENIFDSKKDVKISYLKKRFYDELAEVKKALYEDLVNKKYFPNDPEKVRVKYFVFGLLITIASIVASVFTAPQTESVIFYIFPFAAGLIIPSIFLMVLSRSMPSRTAAGHELFLKAKGYYLFVSTAEKYRQRFFEQKNLFNEVLPYAIVFGLTEKFAKAMKDIGLKPDTSGWYTGSGPFNAVIFGQSIDSFSSSLGKAMASTPSKGGGFSSGGGFSGGGFGGGGGGSW